MKNESMVIWRNSPDVIVRKGSNCFKHGRRYVLRNSFHKDLGDFPIWVFNDITKQIERVVNTRGRAYGLRNALRYRKNLKKVR